MRLWLVRHARPLITEGVCYGAMDVAADENQTGQVAAQLAAVLPQGIDVLTSPLRRCRQLALALQELRPDLVARCEDRLREMDFGEWEGREWNALQKELDEWAADFGAYRAGGTGECVSEFVGRVGKLLHETSGIGRDCAWISHGGVYKALVLRRAGIAPLLASDWPADTLAWGAWQTFDAHHGK